ncbi:MAG: glycosyltransferase family 2 protein, partial [Armatimonadetes bacterium]|nr:glycosyltransferase family 2 protein [Armatimonadota bacterium]
MSSGSHGVPLLAGPRGSRCPASGALRRVRCSFLLAELPWGLTKPRWFPSCMPSWRRQAIDARRRDGTMRVSIIIPVYNEERTVGEVLRRVLVLPIDKEVIVVDDGSTDATPEAIAACAGLIALRLERNSGKGAAIRAGLERASGEYVLIHDADLELLPEEVPLVLAPIAAGRGPVVYGSRFLRGRGCAARAHYLGNRLITGWANLLYGSSLTDVSTAY